MNIITPLDAYISILMWRYFILMTGAYEMMKLNHYIIIEQSTNVCEYSSYWFGDFWFNSRINMWVDYLEYIWHKGIDKRETEVVKFYTFFFVIGKN